MYIPDIRQMHSIRRTSAQWLTSTTGRALTHLPYNVHYGQECHPRAPQHSGGEVYRVRLALGGSAGPITLTVRDAAGPAGESLLQPDTLPLELLPGERARALQ